jgi:hypothetical protein
LDLAALAIRIAVAGGSFNLTRFYGFFWIKGVLLSTGMYCLIFELRQFWQLVVLQVQFVDYLLNSPSPFSHE